MNEFQASLAVGQVGESCMARWFMGRGHSVMPVYDIAEAKYEGPRLFFSDGRLVSPDMMVFTHRTVMFAEVKHKSVFSWHRNTKAMQTGIDKPHFDDYLAIANKHPHVPLWIFFLHKPGDATEKTGWMIPPSGLYGQNILKLKNGRVYKGGQYPKGMIYWDESELKWFDSYEAVSSLR